MPVQGCGGEGRKGGREAPKTLNIYFCLCASKEILALTCVFPPWNGAEVKMKEIELSELGLGNACWETKLRTIHEPPSLQDLIYRKCSASGPKG